MTFHNDFFFPFGQLMRRPLIHLFYPSNLLQMMKNYIMVNAVVLGSFSCRWKRSASVIVVSWSLSNSSGLPLHFSSSRLLSPLQIWTMTALYIFVSNSSPNVFLISQVVSTTPWKILNSNKKITWLCFLSNVILVV